AGLTSVSGATSWLSSAIGSSVNKARGAAHQHVVERARRVFPVVFIGPVVLASVADEGLGVGGKLQRLLCPVFHATGVGVRHERVVDLVLHLLRHIMLGQHLGVG